jgi:RecA/RadA recombinase
MAKKTTNKSAGGSIFDIVKSVDDSAEILSESVNSVIDDYINTGNYILNAAMTGSLFRGAPTGRVLCLAGDPGTGKSYLALSICREGQKKGYTPIYMDSEGSIDKDFVELIGCDSSKMIIKQVSTIS